MHTLFTWGTSFACGYKSQEMYILCYTIFQSLVYCVLLNGWIVLSIKFLGSCEDWIICKKAWLLCILEEQSLEPIGSWHHGRLVSLYGDRLGFPDLPATVSLPPVSFCHVAKAHPQWWRELEAKVHRGQWTSVPRRWASHVTRTFSE